MRVTFQLTDAQYEANDRAGVMVGLPISVQLDAGLLTMGCDAGIGWFERAAPGRTLLKQVSLERHAFSGQVNQVATYQTPEGVIAQVVLDCGLPLRLDALDPAADPKRPSVPFDLKAGDWLLGVASLQGLLALDRGALLWQPVDGAIVEIQRLSLSPYDPAFGTLRWLQGLPPARSFAPDLVFVTVDVR